MSFKITTRENIKFFRKCVQILTHQKEEFCIHFAKDHIRLFTDFMDSSIYYFDFKKAWFANFMAPSVVSSGELAMVQVRCQRQSFLESFNLGDDNELEFLIEFNNSGTGGKIKVIKTREILIVEAHIEFSIEPEISFDDAFEFPNDMLLINSSYKHFQKLKDVFKQKQRLEYLKMQFFPEEIKFEGEIDKNHKYSLKSDLFEGYKKFLDNDHEHPKNFEIWFAMVHMVGLLKICEHGSTNFSAVMELTGDDSCFTMYFTQSWSKDFSFIIAIPNGTISEVSEGSRLKQSEGKKNSSQKETAPEECEETVAQIVQSTRPTTVAVEEKALFSDDEDEEKAPLIDFDLQKRMDFYAKVENEDFF